MKNPRLASTSDPDVRSCLPLFIHIAQAEDFGPNGEPSADIVNEMATDDVPAQKPEAIDTPSDNGQARCRYRN